MNRNQMIEEVTEYVIHAGRLRGLREPEIHPILSDMPGMPILEVRFDRGRVTIRICNATPTHETGMVGGMYYGLCVGWRAAEGGGWIGASLALSAADHMRRMNDDS